MIVGLIKILFSKLLEEISFSHIKKIGSKVLKIPCLLIVMILSIAFSICLAKIYHDIKILKKQIPQINIHALNSNLASQLLGEIRTQVQEVVQECKTPGITFGMIQYDKLGESLYIQFAYWYDEHNINKFVDVKALQVAQCKKNQNQCHLSFNNKVKTSKADIEKLGQLSMQIIDSNDFYNNIIPNTEGLQRFLNASFTKPDTGYAIIVNGINGDIVYMFYAVWNHEIERKTSCNDTTIKNSLDSIALHTKNQYFDAVNTIK